MTEMTVANTPMPYAAAPTTPPSGTHQEVKVAPGDGVLMYWPGQNGFLALYEGEYRELYAEADEHARKIEALQAANRKVTEASIALREAHKRGVAAQIRGADTELEKAIQVMQQASEEVKKKLEPLSKLDAKDGVKMVELVSLRTPKYKDKPVPIYVKSTSLTRILAERRVYLLSDERTSRPTEKVWKDGKLNVNEIKKRIEAKVQDQGFKKKWKLKPSDADAYTGVLSEWARTMNGDPSTFLNRQADQLEKWLSNDSKDSGRHYDFSADAQLMRYTAGAGLEVNFKPFKGNLHDRRDDTLYKRVKRGLKSGELAIKGNATASFAIAEANAKAELYLPHCAGFHVNPSVAGESVDFGYWRFYGSLLLSGGAGASVAVELDIGVTYTGGKQGIRGIPAAQRNKSAVKVRAGANAGLDVFAGVRGGLDVSGALQWLNPEGAEPADKSKARKLTDAVAEFKDIAKVDAGVAGNAGIGIKGAFKIRHENGKFVIYAKLGACLGLGADANCKFEAGTETIAEFFKCVAYQLKRADFHKIRDAIELEAYKAYTQINYLVIAKGREFANFAHRSLLEIKMEFHATSTKIDDAIGEGKKDAEEFLERLRIELEKKTGSWLTYSPPEVLGQLARQIAEARKSASLPLSRSAPELMEMLIRALQTTNHLVTIAERMTPIMGDKQDASIGFSMMNACVADSPFGACVQQTRQRLASAVPMTSTPFIWNHEPEFIAAKLGMEHPMFVTTSLG